MEREFEGKDLEEALQTASSQLGIAEPDLDYEILEQGRRGLFGLGAKSVRIRVMPPVQELSEGQVRRKDRGRRSAKPSNKTDKPVERAPDPARQAVVEDVQSTIGRMTELMGLELEVKARSVDTGIAVDLGGADRKMLTQKDGELISALQFLLNRMARRAWPDAGRIHLSGDGSRKHREGDLVKQTRDMARQVAETGKTKRLRPMNAYDRRLVHITVREFSGLGSRSEGNGYLKRVRIYKTKK
jgi:spoIIIJ-associated protein